MLTVYPLQIAASTVIDRGPFSSITEMIEQGSKNVLIYQEFIINQ